MNEIISKGVLVSFVPVILVLFALTSRFVFLLQMGVLKSSFVTVIFGHWYQRSKTGIGWHHF